MFQRAQNEIRSTAKESAVVENVVFRGKARLDLEDSPQPTAADPRSKKVNLCPITPKQREEQTKRNRRRGFAAVGLLCSIAAAGALTKTAVDETVFKNPTFMLRTIKVDTDGTLLSTAEIEQATGVQKGTNLLTIDLAHIKARLLQEPALHFAQVSHDYQGRLLVVAKQRTPVAWVQCKAQQFAPDLPGGGLLVDALGTAIPMKVIPSEFQGLPIIEQENLEPVKAGEIFQGAQFRAALELMSALQQRQQPPERIVVHKNYALDAHLAGDLRVTFAWDDLEAELPRFDRIMAEAAKWKWSLATLNVINERNFGVTFRKSAAERPAAIPVSAPPPSRSPAKRSARRT